jgi:ADP-ribose pyrophosphatase YjhB (NUDIX family)
MDAEPDRVFLLVVGVVRRDEDVLMVLQAETEGSPYWTLPGGRVEPNEPLVEALAREVAEETGVRIADQKLLYVKQVLTPDPDPNMLVFVFTCEPASPDVSVAPQDPDGLILEAAFLPLAEAISHQETVFGPDEPTVAHLSGAAIESVWTFDHLPRIWR